MNIAGASVSLIRLLEREYALAAPDSEPPEFRVLRTVDFRAGASGLVSLFLYRVDVDPTRRHVERRSLDGRTRRRSLGLDLRYLLTVWGGSAEGEHQVLGTLMEILDRRALLRGDLLDPSYAWEPDDALKVSLESMTNEDVLRLWDALEPAYQLSVSYLVRTLRLEPERGDDPDVPVTSRTVIHVPSMPGEAVR